MNNIQKNKKIYKERKSTLFTPSSVGSFVMLGAGLAIYQQQNKNEKFLKDISYENLEPQPFFESINRNIDYLKLIEGKASSDWLRLTSIGNNLISKISEWKFTTTAQQTNTKEYFSLNNVNVSAIDARDITYNFESVIEFIRVNNNLIKSNVTFKPEADEDSISDNDYIESDQQKVGENNLPSDSEIKVEDLEKEQISFSEAEEVNENITANASQSKMEELMSDMLAKNDVQSDINQDDAPDIEGQEGPQIEKIQVEEFPEFDTVVEAQQISNFITMIYANAFLTFSGQSVAVYSSSSSAGTGGTGGTTSSDASGNVADGYVEGALVFLDEDGDRIHDLNELSAYTDENGFFSIENAPDDFQIVSLGGTDVDSGEAIDVLYSPSGSTMVTPLTTLVAEGADFSSTFSNEIDVLTYNPIEALESDPNSQDAAQLVAVGQQVLAVLVSSAEVESTIAGSDFENAFTNSVKSLVSSESGVGVQDLIVLNELDDEGTESLTNNLETFLSNRITSAYTDIGLTPDTATLNGMSESIGASLGESLGRINADAVIEGQSGALASLTQGDLRAELQTMATSARSVHSGSSQSEKDAIIAQATSIQSTYANASIIDGLVTQKMSTINSWKAQKAFAKDSGLTVTQDTVVTTGETLEALSTIKIDVTANDSIANSDNKPQIVSVRGAHEKYEEHRLEFEGLINNGDIFSINVGDLVLSTSPIIIDRQGNIDLPEILSELRNAANSNNVDYSFFRGNSNTQILVRANTAGDKTDMIGFSLNGEQFSQQISYELTSRFTSESKIKILFNQDGVRSEVLTSSIVDANDANELINKIQEIIPAGVNVNVNGNNLFFSHEDPTITDFGIESLKINNGNKDFIIMPKERIFHQDGTSDDNQLSSAQITSDGQLLATARFVVDSSQEVPVYDYALQTKGKFYYTAINPEKAEIFTEGYVSVFFSPPSPSIVYVGPNQTPEGIQPINTDEDVGVYVPLNFENTGAFGTITFEGLTSDYEVSYEVLGETKTASFTEGSEQIADRWVISTADVLILDPSSFLITPKVDLAEDPLDFNIVRAEKFGAYTISASKSFTLNVDPVADDLQDADDSYNSLLNSLGLDGASDTKIAEDASFKLNESSISNYVDSLATRLKDTDGSEYIGLKIGVDSNLKLNFTSNSQSNLLNNGSGTYELRVADPNLNLENFKTNLKNAIKNIDFSPENNFSGTTNIALTPFVYEQKKPSEIIEADTGSFEVFIRPVADQPSIDNLNSSAIANPETDGFFSITINGQISSSDTDGSEKMYYLVSKTDIDSISAYAYAEFPSESVLMTDVNNLQWYRVQPDSDGTFNFMLRAPDVVSATFNLRVSGYSVDTIQKDDGSTLVDNSAYADPVYLNLAFPEVAKLANISKIVSSDQFSEGAPISFDKLIEITPKAGKNLSSVELDIQLSNGFVVTGPSGAVVDNSFGLFTISFDSGGDNPLSTSDFSIIPSQHFKGEFDFSVLVKDVVSTQTLVADSPITFNNSIQPVPNGVNGVNLISDNINLNVGAWFDVTEELKKLTAVDPSEQLLVKFIVDGVGNFDVGTSSVSAASSPESIIFPDVSGTVSTFTLTGTDLSSSAILIRPKSSIIVDGNSSVGINIEAYSVDGTLSLATAKPITLSLSEDPLPPDASVSDAQTNEDTPIKIPFDAEVPDGRLGFERVGFELVGVPSIFQGGEFRYKIKGDDTQTLYTVPSYPGSIVLGIPGSENQGSLPTSEFVHIDFSTLEFLGPRNQSGTGSFEIRVFNEVFGVKEYMEQSTSFTLEIIPKAETILWKDSSDPLYTQTIAEDNVFELGKLLTGSQTPLVYFEGGEKDDSETTMLKLTVSDDYLLNFGNIISSSEGKTTYRIDYSDWESLQLTSPTNVSTDEPLTISLQASSFDAGDSFVSEVANINLNITGVADKPSSLQKIKDYVTGLEGSSINIGSAFGPLTSLLADEDGSEQLFIRAESSQANTLEFSIDGASWSSNIEVAKDNFSNLVVRSFEADDGSSDYSGIAQAIFSSVAKEGSTEAISDSVSIDVRITPDADGPIQSSVSAMRPLSITADEDSFVSSGENSVTLNDLIGLNKPQKSDSSESLFYEFELPNGLYLMHKTNANQQPDAVAISESLVRYTVSEAEVSEFVIMSSSNVSNVDNAGQAFNVQIKVLTRESNGSESVSNVVKNATIDISSVSDAPILSLASEKVIFTGDTNSFNLPAVISRVDTSETITTSISVTSKSGSPLNSRDLTFKYGDSILAFNGTSVDTTTVPFNDFGAIKITGNSDLRGDNSVKLTVIATSKDGSAASQSIQKTIDLTVYQPIVKPTMELSPNETVPATVGSMIDIPIEISVADTNSSTYESAMVISNVPENAFFLLSSNGSSTQVGTLLSDEASYSGLWFLSANELPQNGADLILVYDQYVLLNNETESADIGFNGNPIKFQAVVTDSTAGTSNSSAQLSLISSGGSVQLVETLPSTHSPLTFNFNQIMDENGDYRSYEKSLLKKIGLLSESDPLIVSFDNDPISSEKVEGVDFELDANSPGEERPVSWVSSWYSDDNQSGSYDVGEEKFGVLTKGSDVNGLSDLYMDINELSNQDSNNDGIVTQDEITNSKIWVDANKNFQVDTNEILDLPDQFSVSVPGSDFIGENVGELRVLEQTDVTSSQWGNSTLFGVGIPYLNAQASQSIPVQNSTVLSSVANVSIKTLNLPLKEDMSGGFPLSIDFKSSELIDPNSNALVTDFIKIILKDNSTGSSINQNSEPVATLSNGIFVYDETTPSESYYLVLSDQIPSSNVIDISLPEHFKGSISINAKAITSVVTGSAGDQNAQTSSSASFDGGVDSLVMNVNAVADLPLFKITNLDKFSEGINEGSASENTSLSLANLFEITKTDLSEDVYVDLFDGSSSNNTPIFYINNQTLIDDGIEKYYRVAYNELATSELKISDTGFAGVASIGVRGVSEDGLAVKLSEKEFVELVVSPVANPPTGNQDGLVLSSNVGENEPSEGSVLTIEGLEVSVLDNQSVLFDIFIEKNFDNKIPVEFVEGANLYADDVTFEGREQLYQQFRVNAEVNENGLYVPDSSSGVKLFLDQFYDGDVNVFARALSFEPLDYTRTSSSFDFNEKTFKVTAVAEIPDLNIAFSEGHSANIQESGQFTPQIFEVTASSPDPDEQVNISLTPFNSLDIPADYWMTNSPSYDQLVLVVNDSQDSSKYGLITNEARDGWNRIEWNSSDSEWLIPQIPVDDSASFSSTGTLSFSAQMLNGSTSSSLPDVVYYGFSAVSVDELSQETLSQIINFNVNKIATAPSFISNESISVVIKDGESISLEISDLLDVSSFGVGESIEIEISGLPSWLSLNRGYLVEQTNSAGGTYRVAASDLDGLELVSTKLNAIEVTQISLAVKAVSLEPSTGSLAETQPLALNVSLSPVAQNPVITGEKILNINEGEELSFNGLYNIYLTNPIGESQEILDTIKASIKLTIPESAEPAADQALDGVLFYKGAELLSSDTSGSYLINNIAEINDLVLSYRDVNRSGDIQIEISAWQDFGFGADPEKTRVFDSKLTVDPVPDLVTIGSADDGELQTNFVISEGATVNISAVSVLSEDSNEQISLRLSLPEGFELLQASESGSVSMVPIRVENQTNYYRIEADLLNAGNYQLKAKPYLDGVFENIITLSAQSVERNGLLGQEVAQGFSLDIRPTADEPVLVFNSPLVQVQEDVVFYVGFDAFTPDADETLSFSFDLIERITNADTGESSEHILTVNSGSSGFIIYDPSTIFSVGISSDSLTGNLLANNEPFEFNAETYTLTLQAIESLAVGMDVLINGRSTGAAISSIDAQQNIVTFSQDPTLGGGIGEGDQITFASELSAVDGRYVYDIDTSQFIGESFLVVPPRDYISSNEVLFKVSSQSIDNNQKSNIFEQSTNLEFAPSTDGPNPNKIYSGGEIFEDNISDFILVFDPLFNFTNTSEVGQVPLVSFADSLEKRKIELEFNILDLKLLKNGVELSGEEFSDLIDSEDEQGNVHVTIVDELDQENMSDLVDVYALTGAHDFNGDANFKLITSSKHGPDVVKSTTREYSVPINPVSDNVIFTTNEVDFLESQGYKVTFDAESQVTKITAYEDSPVFENTLLPLLNYSSGLTTTHAVNVTQKPRVEEVVNLEIVFESGSHILRLGSGDNEINLMSTTPGTYSSYSSPINGMGSFNVPISSFYDANNNRVVDAGGLVVSAIGEDDEIVLNYSKLEFDLGDGTSFGWDDSNNYLNGTSASASIYYLGQEVDSNPILINTTRDTISTESPGVNVIFDTEALVNSFSSILNTTDISLINKALSHLELRLEGLNDYQQSFNVDLNSNAISHVAGDYLDAAIDVDENSSGMLEFMVKAISSDRGAEPFVTEIDVEFEVLRVADKPNLFGVYYGDINTETDDMVLYAAYDHADKDGSESLVYSLAVLDPEQQQISSQSSVADVQGNSVVFGGTLSEGNYSMVHLHATAREDVQGYGRVKEGSEEAFSDAYGIIYRSDNVNYDQIISGTDNNDLFIAGLGRHSFAAGLGVDKLDFTFLDPTGQQDFGVVISMDDQLALGGYDPEYSSRIVTQPSEHENYETVVQFNLMEWFRGTESEDTFYGALFEGTAFWDQIDEARHYGLLDAINVYEGGAGDDQIIGGIRSEVIYGGVGDDSMVGGYGKDYFMYDGKGDDTIHDFEFGHDKLFSTETPVSIEATSEMITLNYSGSTLTLYVNNIMQVYDPNIDWTDQLNVSSFMEVDEEFDIVSLFTEAELNRLDDIHEVTNLGDLAPWVVTGGTKPDLALWAGYGSTELDSAPWAGIGRAELDLAPWAGDGQTEYDLAPWAGNGGTEYDLAPWAGFGQTEYDLAPWAGNGGTEYDLAPWAGYGGTEVDLAPWAGNGQGEILMPAKEESEHDLAPWAGYGGAEIDLAPWAGDGEPEVLVAPFEQAQFDLAPWAGYGGVEVDLAPWAGNGEPEVLIAPLEESEYDLAPWAGSGETELGYASSAKHSLVEHNQVDYARTELMIDMSITSINDELNIA